MRITIYFAEIYRRLTSVRKYVAGDIKTIMARSKHATSTHGLTIDTNLAFRSTVTRYGSDTRKQVADMGWRKILTMALFGLLSNIGHCDDLSINEIESAAQWIDASVGASLHIPDLKTTIDQIAQQPAITSGKFVELMDQIKDFDPAYFAKLTDLLNQLSDNVRSMHLFVRPAENGDSTQVLILMHFWNEPRLETFSDYPDDLFEDFLSLGTLSNGNGDEGESQLRKLGKCYYFGSHSKWLVVGNNSDEIARVLEAMAAGGSVPNSLKEHRAFKLALASISQIDSVAIVGYCKPNKTTWIFGPLSDSEREVNNFGELPWAAATLSFRSTGPRILIHAFVGNTNPPEGIAKVWDSYVPIQSIPAMGFEIDSLLARAWNSAELFRARREAWEEVHGQGSFLESMRNAYGDDDLDFENTVTKRTSGFFFINFTGDSGFPRTLHMEPIDDYEAMARYIQFRISSKNDDGENYRSETRTIGIEKCIVYERSPEGIKNELRDLQLQLRANTQVKDLYQKRYEQYTGRPFSVEAIDEEFIANTAIVIAPKWLLEGNIDDITKQVTAMQLVTKPQTPETFDGKIQSVITAGHLGHAPFELRIQNRLGETLVNYYRSYLKKRYTRESSWPAEIISGKAIERMRTESKNEVPIRDLLLNGMCQAIADGYGFDVMAMAKHKGEKLESVIGVFEKEHAP